MLQYQIDIARCVCLLLSFIRIAKIVVPRLRGSPHAGECGHLSSCGCWPRPPGRSTLYSRAVFGIEHFFV
jgi:hypothetical protein